jgi:glycine cleavage system regulatory protein
MNEQLVLTVIARDRPGIIRSLSETIASHSGNWVDSSMARLGGEFAGILMISVPAASVAALETALAGLGKDGIDVAVRRASAPPAAPAPKGRRIYIELTGADHAGIISEISAEIARLGASVEELTTRVFPGSMSGTQMFEAHLDLVIPDGLDPEEVREKLEDIADDLMVEIEVELPTDKKVVAKR